MVSHSSGTDSEWESTDSEWESTLGDWELALGPWRREQYHAIRFTAFYTTVSLSVVGGRQGVRGEGGPLMTGGTVGHCTAWWDTVALCPTVTVDSGHTYTLCMIHTHTHIKIHFLEGKKSFLFSLCFHSFHSFYSRG
jgi:hypothetical protein